MGEIAGSTQAVEPGVPFENPLVPHRKLKQMYTAMVEARLLEEWTAKRPVMRGLEACRVSALIDLTPEDLVSDLAPGGVTAYLRGAKLEEAVKLAAAKKNAGAETRRLPGLLPLVKDTEARLRMALGAAAAIRQWKLPRMVVAFAETGSLRPSAWEELLRMAAQQELPVLFVALPEKGRPRSDQSDQGKKPFRLWSRASSLGLPGIPVDVSDAVALYRVVQESLGRTRNHAGPVLMECVRLKGVLKSGDPVESLRAVLLAKQACTASWPDSVAKEFTARLKKVTSTARGR